MQIFQTLARSAVALLLAAPLLGACTDPASSDPEIETSERTTKLVFTSSVLITDFPVALGCAALNGSVFIPDATGQTNGTTVTNSDCHWSTANGRCECTITFTQH